MILNLSLTRCLQDGFDEKKVKELAAKSAKGCESNLKGYNICSGDSSKLEKCMGDQMSDFYTDNSVFFAKKCNAILDAMAKPDLKNKVKAVLEEKFKSVPKN